MLVTDGEERAALAVVRSLGRAGYPVAVCHSSPLAIAAGSRYARRRFQVPNPLHGSEAFCAAVRAALRQSGARVAIPVTDASVLALRTGGDAEIGAALPGSSLRQFERLSDKSAAAEAARGVGLAVPEQVVCASSAEVARVEIGFPPPYVLKPVRSVTLLGGSGTKWKVRQVATRDDLLRAAAELPADAFPVLVQRRIVGPGEGLFLLVWEGELMAQFAHRRLRERPPWGGVSVYAESVAAPPDLVARALALLRQFEWRGVAMVELKREAASGEPYLIEVNARFWGSLQLAIDAGVDFPRLLVELATGQHPRPVLEYAVGVRNRWWWGDTDHLLAQLRHRAPELRLPPGQPARVASLGRFLGTTLRFVRDSVFQWTDPRPFAYETVNWVRGR